MVRKCIVKSFCDNFNEYFQLLFQSRNKRGYNSSLKFPSVKLEFMREKVFIIKQIQSSLPAFIIIVQQQTRYNFSCSSSLCFNTSRSKDVLLAKLHKLLKKNDTIQRDYQRIFKTTGFNWKTGYICSEHRRNLTDLLDVPVPASQFNLLKIKSKRAKKERTVASGKKNNNNQNPA